MKSLAVVAGIIAVLFLALGLAEMLGSFYPDVFAPLFILGALVVALRWSLK